MKIELPSTELKKIQSAAAHCALFKKEWFDSDFNGMRKNYCVLLEATCDICNRCFAQNTEKSRNGCKIFEESVLPAFPELEAIWFGNHTSKRKPQRPCIYCGEMFYAQGNTRYCSDACRTKGKRFKATVNQRKNRAQKTACSEFNP